MILCSCGFACPDGETICPACGAALEASPSQDAISQPGDLATQGTPLPTAAKAHRDDSLPLPNNTEGETCSTSLTLTDIRTGATIQCTPPGGMLGREGDFSPEAFTPLVSRVHARVRALADGRWSITHLGRNATAVSAQCGWANLALDAEYPLAGGELVKMADMVFRAAIEGLAPCESAQGACNGSETNEPNAQGHAGEQGPLSSADAPQAWVIVCPVCGSEHAVSGPNERIDVCPNCKDPLDAKRIARTLPRPRLA